MRQGAAGVGLVAILLCSVAGCGGPGGTSDNGTGAPPGATATLVWDAVSDGSAGYRVYWGTSSQRYEYRADVGLSTSHTVTDLQHGVTYFFAVTAYNMGGESPFSSEVSAVLP